MLCTTLIERAVVARLVIVLLIVLGGAACGDDDGDTSAPYADGGDGAVDAGRACSRDEECSDGNACNGIETCDVDDEVCVSGDPLRCSELHPCIPSLGCDCEDPDSDDDSFLAPECAPGMPKPELDCDDGKDWIYPGGTETCHKNGDSIDEDCNPETFYDRTSPNGDLDQDGRIDDRCFNLDELGRRYGGTDCDDDEDAVFPDAGEICDELDNDCNGVVDEGSRNGGPIEPRGLQVPFYPDRDHDGTGNEDAGVELGCDRYPPVGYVPAFLPRDCDDREIDVNIDAVEYCDGVDNDCDGLTDEEDQNGQPLSKPSFPDTDVRCRVPDGGVEPQLIIADCPGELGDPHQLLWCGAPAIYGCTIDGTSLKHCRKCNNKCKFACGLAGCDDVQALALGSDVSCAITAEENIACWGRGGEGLLGNDGTRGSSLPVAVVSATDAQSMAAGPNSACAILGDAAELYCWGSNGYGVLGANQPDLAWSEVPNPVSGAELEPVLTGVSAVDVSEMHACAVLDIGELYCWGAEADGRLGNWWSSESFFDYPVPTVRGEGIPVTDAKLVALGNKHGCMVTQAGTVECWGDNRDAQLGDPSYEEPSSTVLQPVPGLTNIEQITAGYAHTCVLKAGQVSCWGLNASGQLGRMESDQDGLPTVIDGLTNVREIQAGSLFTCAVDSDGIAYCWGSNDYGERGDDSPGATYELTQIALDERVVTLAAGDSHACALTASGQSSCWGGNFFGQLGIGVSSHEGTSTPQSTQPLKRND